MGKRLAVSKATRGVAKAKQRVQSSISNPTTRKFRSQVKSLAVIGKQAQNSKVLDKKKAKKLAKDAIEGKKILAGLEDIDLIEHDGSTDLATTKGKKKSSQRSQDTKSDVSRGTQQTNASFASVWSQCTISSMNDFFQVWDPKLETHKDALAVVAGLSQSISDTGTEQTDREFIDKLFIILSSDETPLNIVTGALLALTFIFRKLSNDQLVENFDRYYTILKDLMEKYHDCKRKTLVKCLLRCFSCLTKAHPMGKEAIEVNVRKRINIAVRQYKVQNKIKI